MANKHAIRIPGLLLDELKVRSYEDDERFYASNGKGKGKKRNSRDQLSRKEIRKRQRQEKKNSRKSTVETPTLTSKKLEKKSPAPTNNELPFSSDDELSSDDFENFDDEPQNDGHYLTVEETMTALKIQKDGKKYKGREKNNKELWKDNEKEKKEVRPLTPAEREAMERDEMEMKYYAKKLGLKGKNKKIHARDEFDAIGGLLEGLDFFDNFEAGESEESSQDENSEEFSDQEQSDKAESSEEGESSEVSTQKPFSSDDELTSGDFDDEDEPSDEDEFGEGEENEFSERDSTKRRNKENPFVAPEVKGDYIPPALRNKQLGGEEESETLTKLRKTVKSSLNKLSDSNMVTIISSLNELFDSNARQYVTDAIAKEILAIICQSNKLLDGFIMNYAAVAFSLWKLRGNEAGALFIQSFVEEFFKYYDQQMEIIQKLKAAKELPSIFSKECNNLIILLAYCYNFGFISCKLVYDLIRYFVKTPNEFTTELLLKVISVSGPLIRGDDPSALKEIIYALLANVKSIKNQPARLRFLLETVSDLKNNRLKPSMLATSHQQLKKILQNILKTAHPSSEPLQVTVDDIKKIETKGKWWLVGASWKGNLENAFEEAQNRTSENSDALLQQVTVKDDLLADIPDWSAIAKQQRMNTDVRRAIFVSIMSAQDYMDAFKRLEKLNLKNKQTSEIPRVLILCLVQDGNANGYNPYYALLARRLCEYQHNLVKSFQFLFWDIIKNFEEGTLDEREGEEMDEDLKLRSISSRGRFFGSLISWGILRLDIFKHVPIISGLNAEGNLFVEVLLYQLLMSVAKNSEVKAKDSEGKKVISFRSNEFRKLVADGIKLENRSVILKGLKWFVTKKFRFKEYIGKREDKNYEKDSRRLKWAVPTLVDIMTQGLEGTTS